MLLDSGELVKITPEFYFQRENLTKIIKKIRHFAAAKTTDRLIDVSVFKDLAGVSRKYAIPLLEYFDHQKITQRVGDKRRLL
jgi:selenocysteine-specific elongation factor